MYTVWVDSLQLVFSRQGHNRLGGATYPNHTTLTDVHQQKKLNFENSGELWSTLEFPKFYSFLLMS